ETPVTPFISPLSGGKLGTHAALLRSAVLTRSFCLMLGIASLTPTYAWVHFRHSGGEAAANQSDSCPLSPDT
ncbi:MAG: hypothetical protein LBL72_09355, partial [Candidatus Accumulibacter sp.]|nr:hypothetical protein [Accumulibacter sp.]